MRILHSVDFIHYVFKDFMTNQLDALHTSNFHISISLIINVVNYMCIFSPSLAQITVSTLYIQNKLIFYC